MLQGAVQLVVAGRVLAAFGRCLRGGRCSGLARRAVAGRTRYALRARRAAAVLAHLLAAQLLRLAVVQLTCFFGHREVHVDADFRIDPAGAGHRFQQFADALVERGFLAAHLFELGGVDGRFAVRVADAEHATALVDHGDAFRRQIGNGGSDHVHDRIDLAAFQLLAAAQFQGDRGTGHITLAGERAGLGNGQMHARIAHRAQRVDGARQLGFQRVLVARAFHELADTETGVALHQLEAELAAVGQARARQFQAGIVQVLFRHGDATGGRVQLERNLCGTQQVGRFSGGLLVQAGVQRHHARLLRPEEHEQPCRHGHGDHRHQSEPTGDLQALQPVEPLARLFGVQGFLGERQGHAFLSLQRHVHHVLVSLDETVTDFHGGAEGDLGLLRGDHHLGQVGAGFTQFEGLGEGAGLLLRVVDAGDGAAQGFGEAGRLDLRRIQHRARQGIATRRFGQRVERGLSHLGLVGADLGKDRSDGVGHLQRFQKQGWGCLLELVQVPCRNG
ncbi:hypothetical protein D3C71_1262790 [compost metagenome]